MSDANHPCERCGATVFIPWSVLLAGFPARCMYHPYKVLVTGSRKHKDGDLFYNILRQFPPNTLIVHGGADGADTLADCAAKAIGFRVHSYPVDWTSARRTFGARYRHCGPFRNRWMYWAESPDLTVGFPLQGSKGTVDMLEFVRSVGGQAREITP